MAGRSKLPAQREARASGYANMRAIVCHGGKRRGCDRRNAPARGGRRLAARLQPRLASSVDARLAGGRPEHGRRLARRSCGACRRWPRRGAGHGRRRYAPVPVGVGHEAGHRIRGPSRCRAGQRVARRAARAAPVDRAPPACPRLRAAAGDAAGPKGSRTAAGSPAAASARAAGDSAAPGAASDTATRSTSAGRLRKAIPSPAARMIWAAVGRKHLSLVAMGTHDGGGNGSRRMICPQL